MAGAIGAVPRSHFSVAAFFPTRTILVADSSQHYPFIGDLTWIGGVLTPVNSWNRLLVHHSHIPQEPMEDVTLQGCKQSLCLH